MQRNRIKILDTEVDKLTNKEVLENIRLFLSSGQNHYAITLNSEMIVRAQEDAAFYKIINNADLVVADGMGVLSAASFLKKKKNKFFPDLINLILTAFYFVFFPKKVRNVLPEKISGIDLAYEICGSDFARNAKIYLLGAGRGVAERAGKILKERYPYIQIVGAEPGFWGNLTREENQKIIKRINSKNPDIVFVALGAPKQEKWIYENLKKMPGVRLAVGVGGSFDVMAGKVRRAPEIMQSHGLEWLWRLILQPQRIGRIYNATVKFAWLLFWSKNDMIGK